MGFVFYQPVEKFVISSRVPGFLDENFLPEYLYRENVRLKSYNYELLAMPRSEQERKKIIDDANRIRIIQDVIGMMAHDDVTPDSLVRYYRRKTDQWK